MRPFNTILCAVDFSDESRHALDHAAVLAKWYDAKLVGVFVHTPIFPPIPEFALPGLVTSPELPEPGRAALNERLEDFLRPAAAAGLSPERRIAVGKPASEILRAAADIGADLIVLGTHGAGGFERLMLGSVAEKVVRQARCPVLTVPPRVVATSTLPFRRILCPVDFGEPSKAALELARSVAAEGDADLVVLHVLETGGGTEPLPYRGFSVPEYHQERERSAADALAAFTTADCATPRCRLSTRIAHGKPYREILGIAAEDRVDLIVIGVHGRGPIDLAFFGSTTNHVVRGATCPVMTVRV